MQRVVIGTSDWARALARAAVDRPGETTVFAGDATAVESLRESGVDAVHADPTVPEELPPTADLVVVGESDPARALTVAAVVARRYPAAVRIAYLPPEATPDQEERLANLVDRTVDPTAVAVDHTLRVAEPETDRARRVLATLRSIEEPLLVVAHDNPDPDAIAAACQLADLAERVGREATAGYYGDISHQENRALVNLLELPITDLTDEELSRFGAVALVDHAVPGVNDSLPPDTEPAIVIDHHPPTGPADATFYDVRPEMGATATILAEYLETIGLTPTPPLATALVYGVRVDTRGFTSGLTEADYRAVARLLPQVDEDALAAVESPSVAGGTFETLATAIRRRDVRESVAVSCVGEIGDRDALPQAADHLLGLRGVTVAVVYGYADGVVYASGRARGTDTDIGETFRDAFGEIGSAGGHADMAGAQLKLGVLGETAGDERLRDVLEAAVSERFFETVGTDGPPGLGGFLPVD